MKKQINIGLSAYNNSYRKGIFYPEGMPASKRFEFYCQHFNTYEINATFYKFPTGKSMKAWYDKSPERFLFAVKAPKTITHLKKFKDAQSEIDEFYKITSEGLKEKLGFVLFQLPPSFDYTPEKLNLIISSLNPEFKNVVELRHESWWLPEVFTAFSKYGITFCSVSYPGLPKAVISTTPTAYIRLHGVPKLFYSGYGNDALKELITAIESNENIKSAYIYFNNTAASEGIQNALYLQNFIS